MNVFFCLSCLVCEAVGRNIVDDDASISFQLQKTQETAHAFTRQNNLALQELLLLLFAGQPVPSRRYANHKAYRSSQYANTRSLAGVMQTDPFDVPRPDPSILISAKSDSEQKLWFGGINIALLAGAFVLVQVLDALESIAPVGWIDTLGNLGTIPLGLLFAAIGVAHFFLKDAFLGIVPPLGTWGGLWQVPAPGAQKLGLTYAEYHTYWTGIAEFCGGLLLAASGFGLVPQSIQQFDAFLLFLLTLAVTPANIYMATHDAQMGDKVPPLKYPDSHLIRGALQIVLLAEFWKLAFH